MYYSYSTGSWESVSTVALNSVFNTLGHHYILSGFLVLFIFLIYSFLPKYLIVYASLWYPQFKKSQRLPRASPVWSPYSIPTPPNTPCSPDKPGYTLFCIFNTYFIFGLSLFEWLILNEKRNNFWQLHFNKEKSNSPKSVVQHFLTTCEFCHVTYSLTQVSHV